ncbi:MAG: Crp/Fnr family transcriptional regulator [Oscillospiraceae bacterium]|jgi:CRP-like cAMP-binding protein|nr:Crp/Fnr family transcriptional regulator [Oscillospiraceae bacterium]
MDKYLPFLRSLELFEDMDDASILKLLKCLSARELRFDHQQIVWSRSLEMPFMCVVVEGGLMIVQEDWRGNRSIIGSFGPGEFISEGAIGVLEGVLPFYLSVRAETVVLVFSNEAAMNPCDGNCGAHGLFLRNLINALLQKEMRLLYKIEYLSRRTTREKLMSFLTIQSARQGSRKVTVEFTRQELADFLSVDRSAMCTELSHMKQDGLIRYDRRCFELLDDVVNK